MIALVISPGWRTFHASSPNLNLLLSNLHADFKKFPVTPAELLSESVRAEINQCEALVVDYTNAPCVDFFTNGPKFLIWGDDHHHSTAEVKEVEALHSKFDYVLAGSPHAPPKSPPYFYVSPGMHAKRLYLPHSVPDQRPEAMSWEQRTSRALLPSNVCPTVYPFRWRCGQLKDAPIDKIPHFVKVHTNYFEFLGTYKYAITCNSHGWLNYMVAKYYEMPYMGAVLIATPPPALEQELIGFKNGENAIFTTNYMEVPTIIKTGDHKKISEAGVELMKQHMASRRLDYISKLVRRAIKGKMTVEDSYTLFRECRSAHG